MSNFKNDKQHQKNLKDLGKFGAISLSFFAAVYAAIWVNIEYTPRIPWFLAVIIIGSVILVPRARRMMRRFEDNAKD